MSNIIVKMKDGNERKFMHEGRAGGSYTKSLKFEGAFAVITDEYHQRTAIPAADIAEIIETPTSDLPWTLDRPESSNDSSPA